MLAPISESGLIMRAMGRRESDSSPNNSLANGWPARMPLEHAHGRTGVAAVERRARRVELRAEADYFEGAALVAF